MDRKIRMLLVDRESPMDGRGVKTVARLFRDRGFEVIFTSGELAVEGIANVAFQEDVCAIGLFGLEMEEWYILRDLALFLKRKDAGDIVLFIGGVDRVHGPSDEKTPFPSFSKEADPLEMNSFIEELDRLVKSA